MGGLNKVNRCEQCHQLIQQGYYCDKCSTEVIIKALRKAVIEYTTIKKDSLFRDNPFDLKIATPTNFGDNLC